MRVFITGASGHIASAVIPELIAAGHRVTELARYDLDGAVAADLRAIEAIAEALVGSDKPLVGTNATAGIVLAGFAGELTESDTLPSGPRIDAENRVIALAGRGVRSSVVRLPPAVHSNGRYGFVSGLLAIAGAAGKSGYVGDGHNRWPSSDTRDVARAYRLALESASAGTRVHAVAEPGIAFRDIAEAIGRRLDVACISVSPDKIDQHFNYLSAFVGLDNPTSSRITRQTLGWEPSHPGLLADLEQDAPSR